MQSRWTRLAALKPLAFATDFAATSPPRNRGLRMFRKKFGPVDVPGRLI